MRRRTFLTGCGAVLAGGTLLNRKTRWGVNAKTTSPVEPGPTVSVEMIASGLTEPVALASPPDSQLTYVADKHGQVFVLGDDGLQPEPLLDLTDELAERQTWEQGLLGFELHPAFERNQKCYVRYSCRPRPGTPADFSHTFVLSEFTVTEDFRSVVPNSERVILELPQPGPNHNAGAIEFGPDGYLYVAVGTGSANGGDRTGKGHARDWYLLNSGGNGQDTADNLKGSILRIDVDGGSADGDRPYSIPDDNPLVGERGRDEHFAWGFRNPYRMSFDGDDLYVGDVGLDMYEEVDLVRKGGNYGWNVREGFRCQSNRIAMAALAKLPLIKETYPVCPTTTPSGDPLVDPIIAYPHVRDGEPFGAAVVGGYVYRNETIPALRDWYVFADLVGGLFVSRPPENDADVWPMARVNVDGGEDDPFTRSDKVLSLGRDRAGELYVLTSQFREGGGKVLKLTPGEA